MNIEINTKDKINIPADYISSAEKRIYYYKRISCIESADESIGVIEELIGGSPSSTILEIKILIGMLSKSIISKFCSILISIGVPTIILLIVTIKCIIFNIPVLAVIITIHSMICIAFYQIVFEQNTATPRTRGITSILVKAMIVINYTISYNLHRIAFIVRNLADVNTDTCIVVDVIVVNVYALVKILQIDTCAVFRDYIILEKNAILVRIVIITYVCPIVTTARSFIEE